MHTLEVSVKIKAPTNKVYHLIRNMRLFPSFMPNVKKLEILKEKGDTNISRWEVDIEGAHIVWKEKNVFDDRNNQMRFNMLEGDYNNYSGEWFVKSDGNSSRLHLKVNIDWGIPSFEKIIGSILERKQRIILRSMLTAIRDYLQKEN